MYCTVSVYYVYVYEMCVYYVYVYDMCVYYVYVYDMCVYYALPRFQVLDSALGM